MKRDKLMLLIIFIILFPFVVIAEENNINDYKVLIDGIDTSFYEVDIEDNDILVTQGYDGDIIDYTFNYNKEFIIDYDNHLFGEYNYEFSLLTDEEVIDTKSILIEYQGDNDSIININDVYYKEGNYFVLGSLGEELTVLDVLGKFNQDLSSYKATLSVIDGEGNILREEEYVSSGDKLLLEASYLEYGSMNLIEDIFTINIIGDVNNDLVIDNLDIKQYIVDDILNNDNSIFSIRDAIDVGIDSFVGASDVLEKYVLYDDNVYVGEILEFQYYLQGFDIDSLSGLEGLIEYDRNILELVDIGIKDIYGDYNENGKFVFLLDNYNKNGLFITFRFRAKSLGCSNVSLIEFDGITSGGDIAKIEDSLFSLDVTVNDYGKGGDVLEDEIIHEEIKVEKIERVEEVVYEELKPSSLVVQHIALVKDSYIESLEIDGYNIEFDKDIYEYFISVGNNVSKLDLDIVLSDINSTYEVIGNGDFVVGNNKVKIVVTSYDGGSSTYVINVEKEKEELIEKEGDTKTKNIIILLIILIIIGLVYIIFMDDYDNGV